MKTQQIILALLISITTQPLFAIGIYKWLDENGKEIYGNNPPENVKKTPVELQELTYIPPPEMLDENTNSNVEASQTDDSEANTQEQVDPVLEITSPKNDEAIRANDGNLSIKFNIQPSLNNGESLVVYLDGKQYKTITSSSLELKNIDRGTHSLFAIRRDKSGNAVNNSESIKFHVLRYFK